MKQKTTIYDLLAELDSFVTVKDEVLEKAKGVKLNANDRETFNEVLKGWNNGWYDETPEQAVYTLEVIVSHY